MNRFLHSLATLAKSRSYPILSGKPTRRNVRRPSFRPILEGLEAREVFSLTPVPSHAGFPYTAIVEIQETFPDNKSFVGSGVMVDSFHVLTAGHVVYSYADGGFATSVTVTPELNGNSAPFGSAFMTYERTYTTFVNFSKAHPDQTAPGDMDIGLLTLNRNIGNSTGWMSFGYDNNNSDFSAGTILNTAGYPAAGGYDGLQMEFSAGQIAGLSSDGSAIMYYQSQITTFGGQSGSPLWRYIPSQNSRVVYGIHVGGSGAADSLNFSTRITQGIFNDLQNWRTVDQKPTSNFALRIDDSGFPSLGTGVASAGAQVVNLGTEAAVFVSTVTGGDSAKAAPGTLTVFAGPKHWALSVQAAPSVAESRTERTDAVVSVDLASILTTEKHHGSRGQGAWMADAADKVFAETGAWDAINW
jgi:V8-like Glu-specific endopeptidase